MSESEPIFPKSGQRAAKLAVLRRVAHFLGSDGPACFFGIADFAGFRVGGGNMCSIILMSVSK